MVVIRLARFGKKNHATFRVIVSDKQKDTSGKYLELLGNYDPHQSPATLNLKEDRVKHWLSVGAQPSASVHNLLVDKGILPGPKVVVARAPKKEEEAPTATAPATASTEAVTDAPAETPAAPEPAPEAPPAAEPATEATPEPTPAA